MASRVSCYRLLVFAATLLLAPLVWSQSESEFRTVETAITTKIVKGKTGAPPQPAYLGVQVETAPGGAVQVIEVAPESPAAAGGLKKGDVLLRLGETLLAKSDMLRELLQGCHPGDAITFQVRREGGSAGSEETVKVVLGATSRPLTLSVQRAGLGIRVAANGGSGVKITDVAADSPADKAALKVGDVLLKLDEVAIDSPARFNDFLSERKPGDKVRVTALRAKEAIAKDVALITEKGFGKGKGKGKGGFGLGWDARVFNIWKKDVYRLAVILVEYPDVKHNAKISVKDWEEALFSTGTYKERKSVTGQTVHGSLNDFYRELSYGRFRVEGKVFDPVLVSKKRAEYAQTAKKDVLLGEAIDKLQERNGEDALKNVDGIFFVYAGARYQTQRTGLYWPHRASTFHKGQRWPYFICPEGGDKMESISVTCHEFGHMLGLPDLYAAPDSPSSEGLGVWCTMSQQLPNGRPQHFSAWCKEQLGWLEPAVIDPTVKQRLLLRPVQHSPKECYKVLLRPDGSEYFLLENRLKKGFDRDLPAEGLLVWRVANGKPVLEESHGIAGPPGPRVFLSAVPFPSKSNDAFTPHTTPSSRSLQGGGLPVHITNIRRRPDGAVMFYIGYEYY
jgi:M6 family metalloprotease-like protein